MGLEKLKASVANFGFSLPIPAFDHTFHGFKYLGVILITAIPFGIYDLVEALDNVESAAVAGDNFPTTRVLTADGVVSLIGCLMGTPFINAVYIGHPGWKAMGGRIGYSAATGIMVIVLSWFGVISVMVSLVPIVAISPILLYIGMLIGAQSFQETPKSHAPAIILGLVPHLAAWGKLQIDNALHAAGTSVAQVGIDNLGKQGILYQGLEVMGGGSILGGLILTAIAVFVIDRNFVKASMFSLAGAVLTFFGFMHGEKIGVGESPVMAASYLGVACVLYGCARLGAVTATAPAPDPHAHPEAAPLAAAE
jgi:AGZA family xanthine/uracil permease-like MFS transporter